MIKLISMQKWFFVSVALLLVGLLSISSRVMAQDQDEEMTVITVQDDVWLYDMKRLGINVGSPDRFGAGQYTKNVIANPGFEAAEYATILVTNYGATATRFQQDNWETIWNNDSVGHPPGFWDGAEYEIVSGRARGKTGIVDQFLHEDGRYTYEVTPDGDVDEANPGDLALVVVRQPFGGFNGDTDPLNEADTSTVRPGSPGTQSLKLLTPGDESWRSSYTYYFDSFGRDGDRSAGKLLQIDGNWRFEIWAKGGRARGDAIDVTLRRGEEPIGMQGRKFRLSEEWELYTYDFYVPPGADAPIGPDDIAQVLSVSVHVAGLHDVWIDDIALYRTDYNNPTVFTDKYVDALRQLNPGIVRNWGDQLGSSLSNQLAPLYARKMTEHHPSFPVATSFHFSLHEFLELAAELGAEPWYVIPPTWTPGELQGLIAYLSAPAGTDYWADYRAELGQTAPWSDIFPTIHLEFGNEMWGGNSGNDPFIGATARNGDQLGQFAGSRIAHMKASPHYNPDNLNFIIGGQYGSPERQAQIASNSKAHDTIALAPYFGFIDTYASEDDLYPPLFARPWQDWQTGEMIRSIQEINAVTSDTELAIYEINFHTTTGDMPQDVRNDFVTGLNGGLALPLYMLTYQKWLDVRNQAAFSAVQFSYRMDNNQYVRVWGMLRDLEATGRKRPTWLGVELANRAVMGDLLVTTHTGADPKWQQPPVNEVETFLDVPYVQSFAYREGDTSSLVLFNLDLEDAHTVKIDLPTAPDETAVLHTLTADSIHADNEDAENVRITTQRLLNFADDYELVLPKHSMIVIKWGVPGEPQSWSAPTQTPLPPAPITPTRPPSTVPSAQIILPGMARETAEATPAPVPTNTLPPTRTRRPVPTSAVLEVGEGTLEARPTEKFNRDELIETAVATEQADRTIVARGYDFVRYRLPGFAVAGAVAIGLFAVLMSRRGRR